VQVAALQRLAVGLLDHAVERLLLDRLAELLLDQVLRQVPLAEAGKAHVAGDLRGHGAADARHAVARHGDGEAAAPGGALVDVHLQVGAGLVLGCHQGSIYRESVR
jgi:hypothetical protein